MRRARLPCLIVSAALVGCVIQREATIHEPENFGFENHAVSVVGLDPARGSGQDLWFDGRCVWLDDGSCLLVDTRGTWCELETVPMDVVLAFGDVAELLCYREQEPIFYIGTDLGDLLVPHTGVGGTVRFVKSSEGVPLTGDLFVRGDDILVWGLGPSVTIIDGDVVLSGDGVQLRNLTITGNLTITSSATSLAYVTVRGNVVSHGQAGVFAKNVILGSLQLTNDGNLMVENAIQAGLLLEDDHNTCDGNFRFTDRDADGAASPTEVLGSYPCP